MIKDIDELCDKSRGQNTLVVQNSANTLKVVGDHPGVATNSLKAVGRGNFFYFFLLYSIYAQYIHL
jgi:hypothetical protein